MFLGLPAYGGRYNGIGVGHAMSSPAFAVAVENAASLLTFGFNQLWCLALDWRDKITHFLLLHSDVIPQQADWMMTLLNEMERTQVQVLSAVIPIKDNQGLTSTGVETGDEWRPRRFTTAEIAAKPETFTEPELVFNTGMMLVDMRHDWVDKVWFRTHDRIVKVGSRWEPQAISEDWDFSRQVRALGVPVAVTRKVVVAHVGRQDYPNNEVWGHATDPNVAVTERRLISQASGPVQ